MRKPIAVCALLSLVLVACHNPKTSTPNRLQLASMLSSSPAPKLADNHFSYPAGLALDSVGNLYVADPQDHCVYKFNSAGDRINTIGSFGAGNGQFNGPLSVGVDSNDNLFVADTGNHRVQKFNASGAFITKWGSQGRRPEQFNNPQGIAVKDGFVYVADSFNHRLVKYTTEGNLQWTKGGEGDAVNQFHVPVSVGIDNRGNALVLDTEGNNVSWYKPDGNVFTRWGEKGSEEGKLDAPLNLTVDPDNTVVVADTNNNRLTLFNPKTRTWIGTVGLGDLSRPQGVVSDRLGNLYVSDTGNHRVLRYSLNYKFLRSWGGRGYNPGQMLWPNGIALDNWDRYVYVADSGNHRIQKFTRTGEFVSQWGKFGNAPGEFDHPYRVVVGRDDCVYVLDDKNCRVQKFSGSGAFILMWGSEGSGNGQFKMPMDLAYGGYDQVFIADTNNSRIQRFSNKGEYQTQWGDSPGDAHLLCPFGLAVTRNGDVFAAEYSSVWAGSESFAYLKKYTSDGAYLGKWGGIRYADNKFWLHSPFGVAVDNADNPYIAAPLHYQEIVKFCAGATDVMSWAERYPDRWEGPVDFIVDLAIDATGDVYAADTGLNCITVFRKVYSR